VNHLVCATCGTTFSLDDVRWRCDCGGLLDVLFTPRFDRTQIQGRKPTMWRYREAIPIGDEASVVSFDEGMTPLLCMCIDGRPVWVKQDHLFPTGSYKDRGASVLISQARALGITEIVEDSSGNAGCAIAAYCARAGIAATIYVPQDTAPAKLAQIQSYGAKLCRVPGTRQDTADAAWQAAQGSYYASHSWNPFFLQGTKTFAYEVCEQLGWRAPDTVVLPAGNGTLVLGAAIGFGELHAAGIIDRRPRIVAVQARACAPLYEAFTADGYVRRKLDRLPPVQAQPTLAEGIAIAQPIRGPQILRAIAETGGDMLAVGEDEIRDALQRMCRQGFYIEPTAAATIAGLRRYVARAPADELIVSVLTGHGLKATDKMQTLP
jgi:threonine synthase